jgi:hypothetical protein
MRMFVQNLSRWTEACGAVDIQLRFSSYGQPRAPIVLLSEEQPHCKPALIQRWTAAHALTAASFFVLAWTTILLLAVVLLAYVPIQSDSFRIFGVVITSATWIAGLLGITDLARIPVRAWIRQLFGATHPEMGGVLQRHRRFIAISVLAAVFLLSASVAQLVIRGYWIRLQYTSLIFNGTNDIDPAIEALKLVPWRTEAPILLERAAWEIRSAGGPQQENRFRSIAERLADSNVDEVMRGVASSNQRPFYLDGSPPVVSNPIAWYASFIIEGEGFNDDKLVNKAMALLRSSADKNTESKLVLDRLDSANELNGKVQSKKVKDFESWLDDSDFPSALLSTHSYLAACDFLFGYHLLGCEKTDATTWLAAELSARSQHNGDSEILWLRPPEKFNAYYMFALNGYLTNAGVDLDGPAATRVRKLTPIGCDYSSDFHREISTRFTAFQDKSEWEKGTMIGALEHLEPYLQESLKKGWRY